MKIALIQDSLLVCAGSERVFKCIVEEFPEADIFTLAYNSNTTCPVFKNHQINTSWANRFIRSHGLFKLLFPISTYIMQGWNFQSYDIIISSSATTAKYIARFNGKHFCFGYFPTRAIWDYKKYFIKGNFLSFTFKLFLPYLKYRDLKAANRVSKFIAQSEISKKAFKDIYDVESSIINSPIDYNKFKSGIFENKFNYYLIVSRLEQWKKLEYAIETFNELGIDLKIIGTGPLEKELKSIAKTNIQFLGRVSDDTLVKEYGRAKALIFTPSLEYGLPPLEANAAGTPVIAFGEGAINETMLPYKPNSRFHTALFFNRQDNESLCEAINNFENIQFNRQQLSKYAKKYSEENFRQKLREFIVKNT